jgi:signal transduction histidine kinase
VRRLHLKFYLAIIGTLLVFLTVGAVVWHHASSPRMAIGGIESATDLAATMLNAPDLVGARQQEILDSLAHQLQADAALFDLGNAAPPRVSGEEFVLTPEERTASGWLLTSEGPIYNRTLDGKRHLVIRPRGQMMMRGVHLSLIFIGIAVTLALLTYPITRSITGRLAGLQSAVLKFGAGDLAVRVPVEGRDEVATLARSFNESASRIEQLVRAHQMLLANCSHELRTPLARIRLAIERVPATDPKINEELACNIAELDALIGEMLLSSRLDASTGLDRKEPIDLLALLAEESSYFDREPSGEAVSLEGDPLLLRRLVRNLLENARVHAGGATAVRLEADPSIARIVVEDAGAGISPADRERIFEPFFRAASMSQATGAGLGLAIVRKIARAHGGDAQYVPRVDGGSRFVVTLRR